VHRFRYVENKAIEKIFEPKGEVIIGWKNIA
jgi:hypothetical protein